MADYIYTLEIRLNPEQLRGVSVVQDVARSADANLYLTGGAVRDLITGFPMRDLDFTLQGNPLRLQKELERAGVKVQGVNEETHTLYLLLPGNMRAELSMARTETYEKTGKPPVIAASTISEDLRRRDFTVNAMALSLNEGSRGLLLDPFNGAADIEAKLLRVLHNYAFLEDPSRLIRASRFAARFHWPLEERTQARFEAAREGEYIKHIRDEAIGYEIEQLAYEDDPLHIVKVLEKEGWLKILSAHWTTAKVDTARLSTLVKTRQQMNELGYLPDPAPAVMEFLTAKLGSKEVHDLQKAIPRRGLVEAWRDLEDHAKELAKRLSGKEAATPARAWQLLSSARPEMVLFLAVTARQQAVALKIKNFLGKWRQVQQRVPLPEMTELRITPSMPGYAKIAHDVFLLLLDGKMRSHTEVMRFLKPLAPPPPPPPPPPKRGRAPKIQAPLPAVAAAAAPMKGKGKAALVKSPAAAAPALAKIPAAVPAKPAVPTKPTALPKPAATKLPTKPQPPATKKSAKPKAKPKSKPKPKPKSKAKPKSKPKKRR
jgi:tRNA nucleotidyltransferase (CCA-adding enzyme)